MFQKNEARSICTAYAANANQPRQMAFGELTKRALRIDKEADYVEEDDIILSN